MNMDKARMLAIHDAITKRVKTMAVEAARGPRDLNPLLFVTFDDGTHWAGKPIDSKMGEDFDLPASLAIDCFLLWCKHEKPIDRIVVVMDAYVQRHDVDDPSDLPDIQRGDLGKDFRSNPASNVTEGMVTSAVWWQDGEVYGSIISHGYRITDGGVLVWDKPHDGDVVLLDEKHQGEHGAVMESATVVLKTTREGN